MCSEGVAYGEGASSAHTLPLTMPSEVKDHASPHRTVLPWKNSVVRVFLTPDCQRPGERGGNGTDARL